LGFDVKNKRVTVVGAARRIAAAQAAGAPWYGSRCERSEAPGTEPLRELGSLELEHRTETFAGADLVVLSPGVPPMQEALQAARAGCPRHRGN
jgi:UDP-N-acetylmuramoylalanine-D-glutamate ligase